MREFHIQEDMSVHSAVAAEFIGNFIIVKITQPALKYIQWRVYVIFAAFHILNGITQLGILFD